MHILRRGVVYPPYATYCMWCNLAIRVQNCKICYYSFHPMIRDDIIGFNISPHCRLQIRLFLRVSVLIACSSSIHYVVYCSLFTIS